MNLYIDWCLDLVERVREAHGCNEASASAEELSFLAVYEKQMQNFPHHRENAEGV